MFLALETALRQWLAPVLPAGVPLLGTLDDIDLSAAGTPALVAQVFWQGAGVPGRTGRTAELAHTWAVHLYLASGRASPALHQQAGDLHTALFDRLMRWRDPSGVQYLQLTRLGAPEWDGLGLRLSLLFSLEQHTYTLKDQP